MAVQLGIGEASVCRILKQLGFKNVCARWVSSKNVCARWVSRMLRDTHKKNLKNCVW
jgi:hypothetical protein